VATTLGRSGYNLGAPGVGLYEYIQLLKLYGLAKNPEIVVLNVYEGNDLRDAARYWDHRRRVENVMAAPRLGRVGDGFLARHSYLFNLAAAAWFEWAAPSLERLLQSESGLEEMAERIDKSGIDFRYDLVFADRAVAFNLSNSDRDEVIYAKLLEAGKISLNLFDKALLAFVELAERHDFVPVVLYSPSAYSAYAAQARFKDEKIAGTVKAYSRALRSYFAATAAQFGYHFLDLTPILQAYAAEPGNEAPERLLYSPESVHYSRAGNRVVATAVAEFLRGARP
jgi:hypothetical protein